MGQITAWECDSCKDIILPANPNFHGYNGYIIEGSIYVAEGEGNGGLIGSGKPVMRDGVPVRTVMCTACFLKALQVPIPPEGLSPLDKIVKR